MTCNVRDDALDEDDKTKGSVVIIFYVETGLSKSFQHSVDRYFGCHNINTIGRICILSQEEGVHYWIGKSSVNFFIIDRRNLDLKHSEDAEMSLEAIGIKRFKRFGV